VSKNFDPSVYIKMNSSDSSTDNEFDEDSKPVDNEFTDVFSREMVGSDVTIRVPRPQYASKKTDAYLEFKCHKFILAARCEYFKAMFTTEMKESASNIVDLPDVKVSTLKVLLKYFYTDVVSEDDVDLDLLKIADMFLLKDLKDYCESVLSPGIKVQDAVNILVFATRISASELAKAALDVILANIDDIKRTQGWKEYCQEDLYQLMAETLASKKMTSIGTSTGFTGFAFWVPDTEPEPGEVENVPEVINLD